METEPWCQVRTGFQNLGACAAFAQVTRNFEVWVTSSAAIEQAEAGILSIAKWDPVRLIPRKEYTAKTKDLPRDQQCGRCIVE